MRVRGFATAWIFAAASIGFFFCEGQAAPGSGKDGPPVVKITAPENNSSYRWGSLVSYSVVVTYQGKSTEYQEIPSKEVLVKATFAGDVSKGTGAASAPTPAGLLAIVRSNCMGCHEFKAKAMGPSFAAIAARYPNNSGSIDTLVRYIREGSTGVWGPAAMPAHPELTAEEAQAMAAWMVKDAGNPDVSYSVGTEGTIRMEAPATPGGQGGMILTASYTAPGPGEAPRGEDTVMLHGK